MHVCIDCGYRVLKRYKKRSLKFAIKISSLFIVILCLLRVWFVPVEVGKIGESPVCKFRLQVFLCDWHNYGRSDFNDIFFSMHPDKYGDMALYDAVGGWEEYFNLKSIEMDKRMGK